MIVEEVKKVEKPSSMLPKVFGLGLMALGALILYKKMTQKG